MPARDTKLAQRYAQALFGAAVAEGVEDQVGDDLRGLIAARTEDRPLVRLLEAPHIRDDEKHSIFDRILKGRVQDLTLKVFHLLLAKRRTFIFDQTAEAYLELLREHRGELKARVWTAIPLDEEREENLRKAIEKRTGKSVEIEAQVDAKVLGGVVVVVGDQIVDGSVRHKLDEMREQLLAAEIPAG